MPDFATADGTAAYARRFADRTGRGLESDAQRAIQFVRSTPGLTTALVGMQQVRHVEENLATAREAPLTTEQFMKLFRRADQTE